MGYCERSHAIAILVQRCWVISVVLLNACGCALKESPITQHQDHQFFLSAIKWSFVTHSPHSFSICWKMRRVMTKLTKWHVCPAKTQISLGIHPVWSESSLTARRNIGSLATQGAHSEDSDQIGWMPRLIESSLDAHVILLVFVVKFQTLKNCFNYFNMNSVVVPYIFHFQNM